MGMSYNDEINGQYGDIFKKLEDIIFGFSNIVRVKNRHQTTYKDEYKTIVMLRNSSCDKFFITSWGQGIKLQYLYPQLKGDGKIVRHLNFKTIEDIDENMVKNMIKESMIYNMEDYEMKQLKKEVLKR
jgi:hypothetical protein